MAERCLTSESGSLLLFLSIKYVTEVINGHSITHLPPVPPSIKGVISSRGQILPIVDIRVCMDKLEAEYTNRTYTVALNVDNTPLGIAAGSVRQAMDIGLDYIRPILLRRQQKLLDGMITAEDDSVLMSFDRASLVSYQHQ